MATLRVLLATEQSFHREAVAMALRTLKPSVETKAIEPVEMEREVHCLAPHLVICSQTSPAARSGGLGWVQIAPGGYWLASIRTDDFGRRNFVSGSSLSDLVSIIGVLMESLSGNPLVGSG